jgi:hypothetical protein
MSSASTQASSGDLAQRLPHRLVAWRRNGEARTLLA